MNRRLRREMSLGPSKKESSTGAAPEQAVVVEGLTKHYGTVHALDGVSFSAAPGEVFGLLGHNGAGKSTTIRILTGRSRPTDGTATILGHDVVEGFEHIRGEINLVAESPTVYMRATAKENLDLFCRLYDVPKARSGEALERVRLDHTGKQKVKEFSTGMKQRLLVARALLNTPRVLFLDEPTRGLDPQSARDLHGIVSELAAEGSTVFLTTHDMTEADSLCHRVAFLSEGRIVALDTPRELKLGLGSVPEVDVVLADGHEQRLRLADEQGSRALVEHLRRDEVRAMHTREPTLADVFIALAGRTLHDDEEAVR